MKEIKISDYIYKRDSKGKIRVWCYEIGQDNDGCAWRVESGLLDGQRVTSGWKSVEPKNIGKANSTTALEQAEAEAMADMKKKLKRGYFTDIESVDSFTKIKPMLATKYENAKLDFEKNEYYSQPKLDGIRCIATANGLWSRSGEELISVPHVFEELKSFFEEHPEAILDGELYNHELKDDFNTITSIVRKTKPTDQDLKLSSEAVQYYIYDAIRLPSDNLLVGKNGAFFGDRYSWMYYALEKCCSFESIICVKTSSVYSLEDIDELYSLYLKDGYEGQMIRNNAIYQENKRSKYLIKRKEFLTDEFEIVEVEEGKGNWAGYAKRFVLKLPNGTEFGAGVRGNQKAMRELIESEKSPTWATVRYFTPTPDGIPRFGVVVDWGEGERND